MTPLRYPLVVFDLDGTLIDDTIYIWKTLHEGFNTDHTARNQAYDDYFAKRITYKEWFEHDLKLLKAAGATSKKIHTMLDDLHVMPGASHTLNTLKANGHKIAIISGSLDIVVKHMFPDFKFDHILINKIHFNESGIIDRGVHTPYDIEAKADGLKELCRLEKIDTSQAVFVGDNENDLWIAKEAGLSIAFNYKSDRLAQICTEQIQVKDLSLILPYIS